jgi:hypothetical protein
MGFFQQIEQNLTLDQVSITILSGGEHGAVPTVGCIRHMSCSVHRLCAPPSIKFKEINENGT